MAGLSLIRAVAALVCASALLAAPFTAPSPAAAWTLTQPRTDATPAAPGPTGLGWGDTSRSLPPERGLHPVTPRYATVPTGTPRAPTTNHLTVLVLLALLGIGASSRAFIRTGRAEVFKRRRAS
jgi:hypothetical protein